MNKFKLRLSLCSVCCVFPQRPLVNGHLAKMLTKSESSNLIRNNKKMKHVFLNDFTDMKESLHLAVRSLLCGHVIAFPTDTVYGIAALAQNSEAVNNLYNIKGRDFVKPIAIAVHDVSEIYKWAKTTVPEQLLHDLLPGPTTVIFERTPLLNPNLNPNTTLVGIRIPDHPFCSHLLKECKEPLALTSANISSNPSSICVEEFRELWPKLDLVFDGGMLEDSNNSRQGSTVIDLSEKGCFKIVREGSKRSYQSTIDVLVHKYNLKEVVK